MTSSAYRPVTFRDYAQYARAVRKLATGHLSAAHDNLLDSMDSSAALRRLVSIGVRREIGAFFTPSSLAKSICTSVPRSLASAHVVLDPACGAGDLLIAACEHLPVKRSLAKTLSYWGGVLRGCDIKKEFVTVAKARLILLARIKHGDKHGGISASDWDDLFPHIRVQDGLEAITNESETTGLVVMANPPYNSVPTPSSCHWTSGSVNQAALFIARCATELTHGTVVSAILPEVLRSGSRYTKWRQLIEAVSSDFVLTSGSQFDAWTDIDYCQAMFSIDRNKERCVSRAKPSRKPTERRKGPKVLEDMFDVRVGPVVPHRDPQIGKSYPYITARSVANWTVVRHIPETRRYSGTVYAPPFVVIKRTSRPSDNFRAAAAVIATPHKVAVENHILILSPRDGKLSSCRKLMAGLKQERINRWLNRRIRCRHLTVGAIRDIPFGYLVSVRKAASLAVKADI